jgi:cytochrome b6-f complex iron-sulfur subunit
MGSRRDFLRNGWKAGTALLAAAAAWTVWESLRPLGTGTAGALVKVGSPANFPPGTATYVSEGRLYVANPGTELFALSQKCPHLGCKVPFCESSGRFECACHGSVFDLGGEWIEGPAPRGMDRIAMTLVDDQLVADTKKVTPGPDHGADQYFAPPKGPNCLGKG